MKDKQISEKRGKKFPPNPRPLAIETVTKVVSTSHPSRSNEFNQITVSLPRVRFLERPELMVG